MVKVEMYKSFDGNIFENREECAAYEQENIEIRYEKLKELRLKLDEYCETVINDCKSCIFEKNCADIYEAIKRGIKKIEDE